MDQISFNSSRTWAILSAQPFPLCTPDCFQSSHKGKDIKHKDISTSSTSLSYTVTVFRMKSNSPFSLSLRLHSADKFAFLWQMLHGLLAILMSLISLSGSYCKSTETAVPVTHLWTRVFLVLCIRYQPSKIRNIYSLIAKLQADSFTVKMLTWERRVVTVKTLPKNEHGQNNWQSERFGNVQLWVNEIAEKI